MENIKPATKSEQTAIEALVAKSDNVAADIIAAAEKQRADEAREREIAQAKENLETIEAYILDRVSRLKTARAAAKTAEEKLLKLSRAANDYKAGKITYNEFSDVRFSL